MPPTLKLVILLQLAAALASPSAAADAERYEVSARIQVDTKARSHEAETLLAIEQRLRACGAYGTRMLCLLAYPEGEGEYRLVVRGTTVPRLVERLLNRPLICGWVRTADERTAARPKPQKGRKGRRAASRKRTPGSADESGPHLVDRADGGPPTMVWLQRETDRAVAAAAIITDPKTGRPRLHLAVQPGAETHRHLVVAGQLFLDPDLDDNRTIVLDLPADPEEQAALLGLVRLAPRALLSKIQVSDVSSRRLASTPGTTLTRRLADVRGAKGSSRSLADPSPLVRAAAIEAAASRSDGASRTQLYRALGDAEPMVASVAARALNRLARVRSVPEAASLLESPIDEIALEGLELLMRSESRADARTVLRVLGDESLLLEAVDPVVRTRFVAAAPLLERIADSPGGDSADRVQALDACLKLAPEKAQALVSRLAKDADPAVRSRAAGALSTGREAPSVRD